MTLGYSVVYPMCKTNGHRHNDREEIYFFIHGNGLVTVGQDESEVGPGDAIYIPLGSFHSTRNIGQVVLEFIWITAVNGNQKF